MHVLIYNYVLPTLCFQRCVSCDLNMIILVRRDNGEATDKLIKFRNSLRDDIIKTRKDKMSEIKDTLPSFSDL